MRTREESIIILQKSAESYPDYANTKFAITEENIQKVMNLPTVKLLSKKDVIEFYRKCAINNPSLNVDEFSPSNQLVQSLSSLSYTYESPHETTLNLFIESEKGKATHGLIAKLALEQYFKVPDEVKQVIDVVFVYCNQYLILEFPGNEIVKFLTNELSSDFLVSHI